MKKTFFKHGLFTMIAVMSAVTVAPLAVNAETTEPMNREAAKQDAQAQKEAQKAKLEAQREEAKAKVTEAKAKAETQQEAAKTRLKDAKLRACEKRQNAISSTMTRVSDRGQKQVDLFSGISERTQAFYHKKGRLLANYDALVADAAAKRVAAEGAVAMITSQGVEFKCDGEDPKGAAMGFKGHHGHVVAALKEYKTSIKNLIVGVKSAQGTMSSEGEKN